MLTFLRGGFSPSLCVVPCRAPTRQASHHASALAHAFWQSVALGATHCGAGCSLADVLVESGMFELGLDFVVLGHAVFGNWIVDYVMSLILGVIVQYAAGLPRPTRPEPWCGGSRSNRMRCR